MTLWKNSRKYTSSWDKSFQPGFDRKRLLKQMTPVNAQAGSDMEWARIHAAEALHRLGRV